MADLLQLPPQALEAEKAVLGSMLIEPQAVDRAVEFLREEDFYKDAHRRVFRAAAELHSANKAVDMVTVGDALRARNEFSDIGGPPYLKELADAVSTAAHVDHYANIVKEKSILRELIRTATDIVGRAYREESTPAQLLDEAQGQIMQVAQRQTVTGFHHAKNLVHAVLDEMERLHALKGEVTGIATGFKDFDKRLAGLQKGDLILIAARPSQGKTALALNIAANVALNKSRPSGVALFSMEMSRNAIMMRLVSSLASVNLQQARTGYFKTDRWANLTSAGEALTHTDLYIDDSPGLSVLELRSRARRLDMQLRAQGKRVDLIMIDYLQLMRGASRRPESRQAEVAEISRGLKHLARDMDVPVVALSQLSRRVEDKGRGGGPDARPQLSDLRESGALEQDADVVAFIYREGYYKRDDPNLQTAAEVIIAKQRNGPVGTIQLTFRGEVARFEDKEIGGEPPGFGDTQAEFS